MTDQSYVIWGGYGGHNLGDEAILWAVSTLLSRHSPGCHKYVLVRGRLSQAAANQYSEWSIKPIAFPSVAALRLLAQAKVIAGGGQLVDDKSLGWPVGWTSLVLLLNRLQGQRPVLFCIGAEPVRRRLTRGLLRSFYSLAEYCVCRDEETAAVMRAAGIRPGALRLARDVVFSLPADVFPARSARERHLRVTVVVSHDAKRTPGAARATLTLAQDLAAAGIATRLIAHDLRHEYDMGMLDLLEQQTRGLPHISVARPSGVAQVLQVYADSDVVISSRMHPLILSALSGAQPIAIRGTAKVASLIENLRLPSFDRRMSQNEILSLVQGVSNSAPSLLPRIAERLAVFRLNVERVAAEVL